MDKGDSTSLAKGLTAAKLVEAPQIVQFVEFLEAVPPGQQVTLDAAVGFEKDDAVMRVVFDDITLHCTTKGSCEGPRQFRYSGTSANRSTWVRSNTLGDLFIPYRCRNCEKSAKVFSVRFVGHDSTVTALKFGEMPGFGPPTSPRLSKLLGSDRDLYFKGRQAENQGMGIAAFTYYRRVVDSRKNALFGSIIKVAQTVGVDGGLVAELEAAKKETQFTNSVNVIKHALPQALWIKGENPLTLLYSALSEHMHNRTDAECLALARNARIVLTELIERVENALATDDELGEAVKALAQAKGKVGT